MMDFYDSPEWTGFSPGHPGGADATRKLVEKAGLLPGSRILDLCCGGGDSLRLLSDLGFCCDGADRESVISNTSQRDPALSLCVWEGGKLPFSDGLFHGVLCECSLSQLDQADTLGEIHRVLADGGLFLVSDLYEGEEPALFPGFQRLWVEDGTAQLRRFAARWLWETGRPFPYTGGGTPQYYYAIFKKDRRF